MASCLAYHPTSRKEPFPRRTKTHACIRVKAREAFLAARNHRLVLSDTLVMEPEILMGGHSQKVVGGKLLTDGEWRGGIV
jgi:hypothetical protein